MMQMQRWILAAMLTAGMLTPAWAGPFSFLRRNRDKQEAAPQQATGGQAADLVTVLKTDPDPSRRSAAAEALRDQSPLANPEIVPVLIEAAQRDPRAEVRQAAVHSLARIRPVSNDVGRVIEQVINSDSSMRVRLSARSALAQYQQAGYRSGAPQGPPLPTSTQEPPLADAVEAGPPLAPPPAAPLPVEPAPGSQLFPQPLPRGPEIYPPPTAPATPTAPTRVAPIPAGRSRTTSSLKPAEPQPLPHGVPLSSYRLIAPPPRSSDSTEEPPATLEPLRHEEPAPPAEPSRLRRFMVDLPAKLVPAPKAEPAAPAVPAAEPEMIGPMLNAPQ